MGKHLILVDGSGYIFRAFYAFPPLTRSDKTPINAVYGFAGMLMKLRQDVACDHLAVVFDAARKTFRQDIYPEYKANREETPPELIPQFPILRETVKAFDIPAVEKEGFEADDLIATYAKEAMKAGYRVTVYSADKDMMQLVGGGVSLFDPMKNKIVTEEVVLEKFGVTPDKVLDVQSLAGDSSDNIPGVPGIGVKTAALLINEYGSLDKLYERVDEITQKKRRETLIENKELAYVSKKLATLCDAAPMPVSLEDLALKEPNVPKLEAFFMQQEFKSLVPKLRTWAGKVPGVGAVAGTGESFPPSPAIPEHIVKKGNTAADYIQIQETKELAAVLEKVRGEGLLAIDTETDSLNIMTARIVGFSLSVKEGEGYYVPLRHGGSEDEKPADLFSEQKDRPKQIPVKEALGLLRPILEDESILKIGHNILYDMHVFQNEYKDPVRISPIEDTMVLSYVLNGARHGHGMDELAKLYLDYKTITYAEVCGTGKNKITFDQVPLDAALKYAAEDADVTLQLYGLFKHLLLKNKLVSVYETIDRPLIPLLFRMERDGVLVDPKALRSLSAYFEKELSRLEKEIHELAGEEFNVNSPAQLGEILFEKMKLPGGVKSSKTGHYSTDVSVLEALCESEESCILPKKVLEFRQFAKLKSTYSDALLDQINPKTGRVHTSFSQTITSTGRLSSSNPNLQNIPIRTEEGREIRKAFIAKPGCVILSADYSQVELRLLAHVAGVKNLQKAFHEGADIHAATASEVFGIPIEKMDSAHRRRAKAINFGIVYGISAFGLANQLDIPRSEAAEYINSYFRLYPEIRDYMERTKEFARAHGYVTTLFGRRCFVEGITDRNQRVRGFMERAAINAPLQGTAADIIKKAMVRISDIISERNLKAKLILQVHDELVFEIPEGEVETMKPLVKGAMENVISLSIPLTVDVGVGQNWDSAH